jgi:Methyltransferase domain
MKSLQQLWDEHEGRLVDKWAHYLPIYERHFARFRGTPVSLLEIGVAHGGSLQLWRAYFGKNCVILGLDIDPRCAQYSEPHIYVYTLDQADPAVCDTIGRVDIVIDDGSHRCLDQVASFKMLWPRLAEGGVYLIEDCHAHGEGTFIEWAKNTLIGNIIPIAFYQHVVVLEKDHPTPKRIVKGTPSRALNADEIEAYGAIDARYRDLHPGV